MTWFIMRILSFFRPSLGLNERKLLRILRVRSRARIDGRRDLPATEETRLSTTEEAIMAAFQNSESQLQQLWSTRCRQHAQNMEQHAFSAKESDYDTPVARAKVTLAKAKQDLRDRMVQARVRERDLLGALRAFQTQHELERDAKYPEVPLLALSLLIALALIEALLNANIFADVSNWGLLGGAAAALGMSVPNVLGGAFIGFFGVRGALHINTTVKVLSWALAICGSAALTFYNFYLAHYRALLSTNNDAEFFATWSRVFDDPFGFMAAQQSVILLLLGMLAAGLSVWKGVDGFTDPYPGYAGIDKKYRRALTIYEEAKVRYRSCVGAVTDKAVRDIEAAIQGVDRKQSAIANIVGSAVLDMKAVEGGILRSANACRSAFNVYRRENILVRRAATPAYFDHYPNLKPQMPGIKESEVIALRDRIGSEAEKLHQASSAATTQLLSFAKAETAEMEKEIAAAERSADEHRKANTARAIKATLVDTAGLVPA